MPDKEDRGTTEDPKWGDGDYTGGNDSGTAGGGAKGDKPQGPDKTSRMLRAEHSSVAGAPGPDPSMTPPRVERKSP
jgi:hypothetical protein